MLSFQPTILIHYALLGCYYHHYRTNITAKTSCSWWSHKYVFFFLIKHFTFTHRLSEQAQMAKKIESCYAHTRIYQNKDLQARARALIPLAELQQKAESDQEHSNLDFRDRLVLQLLHWFKHTFFQWVNEPSCDRCQGPTQPIGVAAPTPEEAKYWAYTVEVYSCKLCRSITRFPRYNHRMYLQFYLS